MKSLAAEGYFFSAISCSARGRPRGLPAAAERYRIGTLFLLGWKTWRSSIRIRQYNSNSHLRVDPAFVWAYGSGSGLVCQENLPRIHANAEDFRLDRGDDKKKPRQWQDKSLCTMHKDLSARDNSYFNEYSESFRGGREGRETGLRSLIHREEFLETHCGGTGIPRPASKPGQGPRVRNEAGQNPCS